MSFKRIDFRFLAENIDRLRDLLKRLLPLIEGMQRFPMRPFVNELNEKRKKFETEVLRRFERGEGNLFSLCVDPEYYYEEGRRQFLSDWIAYKFWIRSESIEKTDLAEKWGGDVVEEIVSLGFGVCEGDRLIPRIRIVPFGGKSFVCDVYDSESNDMVYLSFDSLALGNRIRRTKDFGGTVLDLYSGSGILGLLCEGNARVFGYEKNSRAVDCARLNAMICRADSCYECVDALEAHRRMGEADFVVFNPPFIFGPANRGKLHSSGGRLGIEKVCSSLEMIQDSARDGCRFVAISQSPIVRGKDLLLENCKKLERLKLNYEYVDSFSFPEKMYGSFYRENGVDCIRQVILEGFVGKKGGIKLAESDEVMCFA